MASRIAAVSRTERVTTPSALKAPTLSPSFGPFDKRPRDGFSPINPHRLAGMRVEPPPSFAWAAGTMPAATAAAEPPLDPPTERVRSHGLRVGPNASGSVVTELPSSGVFVLPRNTNPAARNFAPRYESAFDTQRTSR